jgi:hypothetical protein
MMKTTQPVTPTDTTFDIPSGPMIDALAGRWAHLKARLLADRYDRQVDAEVLPLPGSALAAHIQRLASRAEAADLARTLRMVQHDAREPYWPMTARIPVQRREVFANEDLIEEIVARLTSGRPLGLRGIARLRMLVADGTGPLYLPTEGSLRAALRGVLATL